VGMCARSIMLRCFGPQCAAWAAHEQLDLTACSMSCQESASKWRCACDVDLYTLLSHCWQSCAVISGPTQRKVNR
jgi:hypothetical protein